MGQAWAYINGAVLNVDIYAHYGLGMPIFIALLAKGLGIFSYTGVLAILVGATIIYFILCYLKNVVCLIRFKSQAYVKEEA